MESKIEIIILLDGFNIYATQYDLMQIFTEHLQDSDIECKLLDELITLQSFNYQKLYGLLFRLTMNYDNIILN